MELCILHLAMAEITVLGTRHQIVINEVFSSINICMLMIVIIHLYFALGFVKTMPSCCVKAVDLAKRFCDGAAPRIVNGCLRTFVKDIKETDLDLGLEDKQQ